MKISFAKEKKKHLQSLNDCKPGWSKEPQWENDCGYFSHSFLLVLSWDQIIFDSMVIVLWHSVNCPLKVDMSIFEWYMVRCGCKGWLTRGSKSLEVNLCNLSGREHGSWDSTLHMDPKS